MSLVAVLSVIALSIELVLGGDTGIDRHGVISRFNPHRSASSPTTPMQVGNGNFAFGADITGLQTFQPWAIMSTWGVKNDSLPAGKTQADVDNYKGVSWLNHGRPVQYDFDGSDPVIEQWLTANPNRVNLANVALIYLSPDGTAQALTEDILTSVNQTLDLWTGTLTSQFHIESIPVVVTTRSSLDTDSIGISIDSQLVQEGRLTLRLDFPWNDGSNKFEDPFVGWFNMTTNHTTSLNMTDSEVALKGNVYAQISHTMDNTTFFTSINWENRLSYTISRDSPLEHRYSLIPAHTILNNSVLAVAITFSPDIAQTIPMLNDVTQSASSGWPLYWTSGGFIDLTDSDDDRAMEVQRRIILSQYLLRVNEAGDTPPQESGLVNNGWYGKFHMEMFWWHSIHWATWNQWSLLNRASSIYQRFLPSAIRRAQIQQQWPAGARWPKMTDFLGRSSPGEINNLLIWEQPHPIVFAEYEYRAFPTQSTLNKWNSVVKATADWMSVFAWFNGTATGGHNRFDIGPPMYVVSEDTSPNITRNPAFELAYWRYTLDLAQTWMARSQLEIPPHWKEVADALADLPSNNDTYSVYEGIENDFWNDPAFINDHPALVGLYGWLPQTPGVNIAMANATATKVWSHWNISNCWGWDFPMLALSAARTGQPEQAVNWLLHPLFQFDDVGMPVGGVRVPTPYFPGAGSLLYAAGMMAAGWDNQGSVNRNAPGFPEDGWVVKVEKISKTI